MTRREWPECRTCGHHTTQSWTTKTLWCRRWRHYYPPDHGCKDHTALDPPGDPREVSTDEHGLPVSREREDA
ncbi:MAG: hypothetical protein GVY12_12620 [Bacteroidetes bacterium]|jgi:hypothetical protein|nr:hypothetical protein [Bacteroidota bacterium]